MISPNLKEKIYLLMVYFSPLHPVKEEMRRAAEIRIRLKTLPVTLKEDKNPPVGPPVGSSGESSGGGGGEGSLGGFSEGSLGGGAAAEGSVRGATEGSERGAAEGSERGSEREVAEGSGRGFKGGVAEGSGRGSGVVSELPPAPRLPAGERTCASCGISGAETLHCTLS